MKDLCASVGCSTNPCLCHAAAARQSFLSQLARLSPLLFLPFSFLNNTPNTFWLRIPGILTVHMNRLLASRPGSALKHSLGNFESVEVTKYAA